MIVQQAFTTLKNKLQNIYTVNEATNIANWALESITNLSASERLLHKEQLLTTEELDLFKNYTSQLLLHKPIQQVVQHTWFCNKKFFINEHVLIPRPETEELVQLLTNTINKQAVILDIGTGSGCIAISIKNKLPNTIVNAIDVSINALHVAKQNAVNLNAEVNFLCLNILDETNWLKINMVDCIVSNPPYIKQSEAGQMENNVLQYEPHIALFVADDDPLIFYKKIALLGKEKLTPNGNIFVEINEALANETMQVFATNGYTTTLYKDLQGKDRMIKAVKQA